MNKLNKILAIFLTTLTLTSSTSQIFAAKNQHSKREDTTSASQKNHNLKPTKETSKKKKSISDIIDINKYRYDPHTVEIYMNKFNSIIKELNSSKNIYEFRRIATKYNGFFGKIIFSPNMSEDAKDLAAKIIIWSNSTLVEPVYSLIRKISCYALLLQSREEAEAMQKEAEKKEQENRKKASSSFCCIL